MWIKCVDTVNELIRYVIRFYKNLNICENLKRNIEGNNNKMIDIKPSPDYLNRTSGGSFSNFSMLFAGEIRFSVITFKWQKLNFF